MARPKKDNGKNVRMVIRADESLDKAVRDFMKTRGIDNKSEAARELIGLGILHYFMMSLNDD